jgi:hypothetical protein
LGRTDDIHSVQHGVELYETNVSGSLPTTTTPGSEAQYINICGPSCQNDGSTSIKLLTYNPKSVSIKPYQAHLQVPNTNSVYLVADATCNDGLTGLGNTAVHSMAILYELSSLWGTNQHCLTVASHKFVDVNKQPYCGISFTAQMSPTEYAFAKAKITLNKSQATISAEMVAAGNGATPGIIDDQLAADSSFVTALQKIHFSGASAADASALQSAIIRHDAIITQERELLRDNSPIPTSLFNQETTVNAQRESALLALFSDLGLPDPTCSFEGP